MLATREHLITPLSLNISNLKLHIIISGLQLKTYNVMGLWPLYFNGFVNGKRFLLSSGRTANRFGSPRFLGTACLGGMDFTASCNYW